MKVSKENVDNNRNRNVNRNGDGSEEIDPTFDKILLKEFKKKLNSNKDDAAAYVMQIGHGLNVLKLDGYAEYLLDELRADKYLEDDDDDDIEK